MSRSLFSVTMIQTGQPAVSKNVTASDADGASALEVAVSAALNAAPSGAAFLSAREANGRPIDVIAPPAVSPMMDVMPQIVYSVEFRQGSGPDGSTPTPLQVEACAQTDTANVIVPADKVAIKLANATAKAVSNYIGVIGVVDIQG